MTMTRYSWCVWTLLDGIGTLRSSDAASENVSASWSEPGISRTVPMAPRYPLRRAITDGQRPDMVDVRV